MNTCLILRMTKFNYRVKETIKPVVFLKFRIYIKAPKRVRYPHI